MLTATGQPLQIVPYDSAYRDAFRQLNEAWITRYFRLEEADNRALDDPEGYILAKGGFIFMALWEGEAVGACALIKVNGQVFELAKMAVDDKMQGKGIGYALGKACIDKAKVLGIKKVELLSNTRPSTYTANWVLWKCRYHLPIMNGRISRWKLSYEPGVISRESKRSALTTLNALR